MLTYIVCDTTSGPESVLYFIYDCLLHCFPLYVNTYLARPEAHYSSPPSVCLVYQADAYREYGTYPQWSVRVMLTEDVVSYPY